MSSTSFIESGLWGSWNYGVCFQATEAALVRGDWIQKKREEAVRFRISLMASLWNTRNIPPASLFKFEERFSRTFSSYYFLVLTCVRDT